MKEKKVVILITAIISVLVVAIAITSVFLLSPSASYTRSIHEAENLVEEGDYENAVLAYQEAIEKDPDNVEAYLGLAELYEKSGEISLAIQTLETGYRRTKSAQIKVLLNRMVETEEETVSSETLAFNDELLSMFSTYREEDYEEQYGRSDGRRDARFEGLDAEIRFDEDGIPTEIHLDDILTLFDRSGPISIEELEGMSLERFRTKQDARHGKMVVFESRGTEITIALEDDYVTSDSYNAIVPLTIEEAVEEVSDPVQEETEQKRETICVRGQVQDILDDRLISNATVTFSYQSGSGSTKTVQAVTDQSGMYETYLEKGRTYTMTAEKDAYISLETVKFTIPMDQKDIYYAGILVRQPLDDIKIILEWNTDKVEMGSALETNDTGTEQIMTTNNVIYDKNGEIAAYKEITQTGNMKREVITIVEDAYGYLYRVLCTDGEENISDTNVSLTFQVPGLPDYEHSVNPDNNYGSLPVVAIGYGRLSSNYELYLTGSNYLEQCFERR